MPPLPSDRPTDLFHRKLIGVGSFSVDRYVQRADDEICLLCTDGACLNNGQANPKAGWAFVFGSPADPGPFPLLVQSTTRTPRVCQGRLELEGPFGDRCQQASNRAELRAELAALRARVWYGEGFHTVVIATDSEYAVKGATEG